MTRASRSARPSGRDARGAPRRAAFKLAPPSRSTGAKYLITFPCTNHAPAVVRAALSEITALDAVLDDVILVASELVTNAVMHSGGSAADTIQVQVVLADGNVLISVGDPGLSGDSARMGHPDVSQATGRGLRIVNQLARQWGVERDRRYRVWAQLATDRQGAMANEILPGGSARTGPLAL